MPQCSCSSPEWTNCGCGWLFKWLHSASSPLNATAHCTFMSAEWREIPSSNKSMTMFVFSCMWVTQSPQDGSLPLSSSFLLTFSRHSCFFYLSPPHSLSLSFLFFQLDFPFLALFPFSNSFSFFFCYFSQLSVLLFPPILLYCISVTVLFHPPLSIPLHIFRSTPSLI